MPSPTGPLLLNNDGTVADLEIFKGGCKPPGAVKLPTLGGSGGMLTQENFVILMWILKHLGQILVV